jgi:hypothetical protein
MAQMPGMDAMQNAAEHFLAPLRLYTRTISMPETMLMAQEG